MDLPLPFGLAIGLAAGTWVLVLALRLPTLQACLGLLFAVACLGPAFAKWQLGPLSASPDRLALILLIGLIGLKRLLTIQPIISLDRCDYLLGGLLALLCVSIAIHPNPPLTKIVTPTPSYMFFASYLSPALLYWITRFRPMQGTDPRLVLGFFVLFGAYLSFTAVCEWRGFHSLVFPSYILQTRLHYEGRSVGPFLSAPALGTWMTVATCCLVLLVFRVQGVARVALVGLFPLFALAEYLTETRSAWMGYVTAIPLAAVLAARTGVRHVIVVGIVLAGLVGGLFAGERFLFPERKEGRGVVAQSTYQRLGLLQRSLSLFVQRPILGWGFGQFEYAAQHHGGGGPLQIVPPDDAESLASHNVFLRFLAELGVIGFALQMLVFGVWVQQVWRILKSAEPDATQRCFAILFACALCAYVAEAMFHDVTFIPQDNMLLFFLAGCMGMRPLVDSGAPQATRLTPRRPIPIGPNRWNPAPTRPRWV
jgi:O-antigen ligase